MAKQEFVTIRLDGQLLGIPVLAVHDVIKLAKITPVPLASAWVAGVLNLRGRIVTAIDLRKRLGLPSRAATGKAVMSVVAEHKGEPYALMIDSVGEVLSLEAGAYERNPVTLDPRWRSVSDGIYRLESELMVVLNVDALLAFDLQDAA
jgi:purine-binding chemotaxis protein CheW